VQHGLNGLRTAEGLTEANESVFSLDFHPNKFRPRGQTNGPYVGDLWHGEEFPFA
jgi:hypothetical protein